MELRHLETLATVLSRGNFLGAARALGCSQSTVTLHIQELERDLGVALFEREGRKVRLTAAGESLQRLGRRVLDGVSAMRRAAAELREGTAGELSLGAVEPVASDRVGGLLAGFVRARPGLRLRFEVGGTGGLSRRVAEGALDLAICSPPDRALGLEFRPAFLQAMELLLPRRHPLARARRVRARDLGEVRLLLSEQGCAYRSATEAALLTRGVRVTCALELGSQRAIQDAVRGGLGVALVPSGAGARPPAGLVLRPLDDVTVALPIGLARRREPYATRAEEALAAQLLAGLIDRSAKSN